MAENNDDVVDAFNEELQRYSLLLSKESTPEYKVYYDDGGHIISYSVDQLDGNYIVISAEQYAEGRHDARVEDGKLIYTHTQEYTFKLHKTDKNCTGSYSTTKYDVNILVNDDTTPCDWWAQRPYKLRY